MHEKKRESVLNKLREIVENASGISAEYDYTNWRSFERNGVVFDLAGGILNKYNDILKDILKKEKWDRKFSEKYVDTVLRNLLLDIVEFSVDVARENFISACLKAESYSVEQTIYVPLDGIVMYEVDELSLGKIQLKKITEVVLDEVLEATRTILRATRNSPEEQETFIRENEENLSEIFLDRICAVCRVVAEPHKAKELAQQETQIALDLLRYSIPALYRRQDIVRIGFLSQVPSSFQPTLVLSCTGYVLHRDRPTLPYELSPVNLETLRRIGVFQFSELLESPYEELNDFERTLLKGVHWFARSQTQIETENEFLNLVTCLETFFTREKGEPISNSIAEGIAFVLSEDLTKRKHLKKRVKELHNLRSEVSHGGHSNIFDVDVQELKMLSMKILREMLAKKSMFTKRTDLINWLEDQKLS